MKPDEKICPRCAEVIKKDALVCKHCGNEFSAAEIAAEKAAAAKASRNGLLGCVALIGLIAVIGTCSTSENESQVAEINNVAEVEVAASPAEAKAMEAKNKDRIAAKLADIQKIPASDVAANAAAYGELVSLAPANAKYVEKRDHYQSLLANAALYESNPEQALQITKFDWEKGGFGSVQLVRLTVKNSAPFPIKDFTLTCNHQGPSGTDMDSNTRVVYELVPANGSKRIREVSMGFINSQVTTSRCDITDAVRA